MYKKTAILLITLAICIGCEMRAKVDSKPIEKTCPEPIDTSVQDILEQCSKPGIHPSMLNKVMIGDKMIFCRGASDE